MRKLLCPECGADQKAKPLHPEDAAMGFEQRFVDIQALKLPQHFGVTINGVFKLSNVVVCEGCNKELPVGSPAVAWSMARGIVSPWEHEYESSPDPKKDTVKQEHAPGMWEDANGNMHLDIPTLLAQAGLDDTLENRRCMTQVAIEFLKEHCPGSEIVPRP